MSGERLKPETRKVKVMAVRDITLPPKTYAEPDKIARGAIGLLIIDDHYPRRERVVFDLPDKQRIAINLTSEDYVCCA